MATRAVPRDTTRRRVTVAIMEKMAVARRAITRTTATTLNMTPVRRDRKVRVSKNTVASLRATAPREPTACIS